MATSIKNKKVKVCYVLSYKEPEYIRTRVLLNALSSLDNIELFTAVNKSKSILRYFQTIWLLIKVRIRNRPDVYILGFRGHEIYWPVRFLTFRKPLIFDEFINMQDWLTKEHRVFSPNSFFAKVSRFYVRQILKSAKIILSDTQLDAKSSSESYSIPIDKYKTIYVGEDEKIFYPRPAPDKGKDILKVFFYGNMAPLHGLEHILEAAKILKTSNIQFTIIGGKGRPKIVAKAAEYIKENDLKNVRYKDWTTFDKIPSLIADSDVCLGGPYGDTSQSRRVITGKTFQFLAMGKPTVVGKINEDAGFKNYKNCILIEQGSAQSIVNALKWAEDHKTELPDIGRCARDLFEKKFSTKIVAREIGSVLSIV